MPRVDIVVESKLSNSPRVRQMEALFDVPQADKSRLEWHGEIPFDQADWNVGLIVGPSGSGKTTIAKQCFGADFHPPMEWKRESVIDDFDVAQSMESIAAVCQAVGFNTIPAWLRPYAVLSNGERFRVELARRLLELPDPIVVDEFTSVVDRQVAQIGAHAIQKYVRKKKRRFVAISCHYDIVDWLQPDWIFEPATMMFTPRRSLQSARPKLNVAIERIDREAWRLFAPFHYLTAELHRAAKCFGLFVGDRIASFAAMLHRPLGRHSRNQAKIWGVSRLVTLPDWQGLGLAMILSDALGAAYSAIGCRTNTYPAHPSLIRSFDNSPRWALEKRPGRFSSPSGNRLFKGGRPCAVFQYCGPAMDKADAEKLLAA